MDKLNKIGLPVVVTIMFLFIVLMKSAVNIGYGEAGVLFKTFGGGVVTDEAPLGEGFHIIAPWNTVYLYNVKQQEVFESQMQVLSSNGLEISLDVSVLYQPKADELGLLHQTKGSNYLDIVIVPNIRAVARSVVGRYTPEQLYSTKRDAIESEIYDELKKGVEKQYVQINDVLVRDVTLPNTIKQAIERKLSQEQMSLEYEFKLESARKEAEKVRIDAQGKADANRILNSSLTTNILRDKGIEATTKLAESPNSKVIVIGSGKDGLPIILGNQ
jgi:regulator of protease activity HflC (stomatin/prohibitin superfamily)|tara:strand:- start:1861 stop:2679 length:819 start_codon:yes stop_codon:yes gene_type:complete